MKRFLGLAIIGALSLLAFPGHDPIADAQNSPVANPPMSSNPEIAALQAQGAILQKQLGILNQKLDAALARFPASQAAQPVPVPETIQAPAAIQAAPQACATGTCSVPAMPMTAAAPLAAGACSSQAADYGVYGDGTAAGRRIWLFPRIRESWRARRNGGAGGCGG